MSLSYLQPAVVNFALYVLVHIDEVLAHKFLGSSLLEQSASRSIDQHLCILGVVDFLEVALGLIKSLVLVYDVVLGSSELSLVGQVVEALLEGFPLQVAVKQGLTHALTERVLGWTLGLEDLALG